MGKTRLNDRDFKHFFIAPTCAKMIKDEELRAFFELLISNKPGSTFTSDLKKYVDDAKKNMQWRHQYMTYLRQRAYDLEEGKEEGRNEKAVETATNLLTMKLGTVEQIAKAVKLPVEKVQELAESI